MEKSECGRSIWSEHPQKSGIMTVKEKVLTVSSHLVSNVLWLLVFESFVVRLIWEILM